MLIDRGGLRSCDMSYLNAADIYLGDVSSQIYEFIRQPRPYVFLNAHQTDYFNDPSYASWRFGPVVRNVGDLPGALRLAQNHGDHYLPIQKDRFAYTFADSGARQPSECGADIIAQYLATGKISSRPLPWPANFNCPSAELVKDCA